MEEEEEEEKTEFPLVSQNKSKTNSNISEALQHLKKFCEIIDPTDNTLFKRFLEEIMQRQFLKNLGNKYLSLIPENKSQTSFSNFDTVKYQTPNSHNSNLNLNGNITFSRFESEFTVIRVLYENSNCTIFQAINHIDGSIYAIKRIKEPLSKSELQFAMQEARIMPNLRHDNLVRYNTAWVEFQINEVPDFALKYSSKSSESYSKNSSNTLIKHHHLPLTYDDPNESQSISAKRVVTVLNEEEEDEEEFIENSEETQNEIMDITSPTTQTKTFTHSTSDDRFFESLSDSFDFLNHMTKDGKNDFDDDSEEEDQKSPVDFLFFLQMELCSDITFSDLMRKLNLKMRLEKFIQVCKGLQYLHDAGIVHRDLKPSNILIGSDGEPKLVDFGISVHIMKPSPRAMECMTAMYASPEHNDISKLSTKSDIYSLGIIFTQLLGTYTTKMEEIKAISGLKKNHTLPPTFNGFPKLLTDLILSMVDDKIEKRPYIADVISILSEIVKNL